MDSKNKTKKQKPAHSVVANMMYMIKLQWQNGGRLCIMFSALNIPLELAISFCGIYMPKVVLAQIMGDNSDSLYRMAFVIGLFGAFIALLNIAKKICETYKLNSVNAYCANIWQLKYKKTLYTDYENMESAKFKTLAQRAEEALWMSGPNSALINMFEFFPAILKNILGYVLFCTVISLANPWIAAVLSLTALINYFVVKAMQNFQYKKRDEQAELNRKLWYIANNAGAFESAKDIKIYGMNTWFLNLYKTLTKRQLKIDAQIAGKYYISNIVEAITILLRDGIAYIMLIYMATSGNITVDNFVLCFGAIGGLADWIGRIFHGLNGVTGNSHLICDLRDFLDYPEKTKTKTGCPVQDKNLPCEIELKDLAYRYENAESDTLKSISLKIGRGEKIALVGQNGAGKTTLIKNICGLYAPTSGDVYINGQNKNEYNIYDYFSMFSVVFQDFHFLPISIAETVSCKPEDETDIPKVKECLRLAGLEDKINSLEFGINSKLNKQINPSGIELSGGEAQKLLIARAIYKDAPILILDEPTAALDPIAESELYQKYNEITKNKTAIYISHRLASMHFCDRILLLDNGQIAESGTHDELMRLGGKYAQLFEIQSHYYKENKENPGGENREEIKI